MLIWTVSSFNVEVRSCDSHKCLVYHLVIESKLALSVSWCICRSTFTEFSSKFGKNERFKAVDRLKEREALFNEYITELKKSKKDAEKAVKHKEDKVSSSHLLSSISLNNS